MHDFYSQIEHGGAYICSQNKRFVAGNYGKRGTAFSLDGRGGRGSRRVKNNNSAPSSGSSGGGGGGGKKPNSADGRIIKYAENADFNGLNF